MKPLANTGDVVRCCEMWTFLRAHNMEILSPIYIHMLKACRISKDVAFGRQIHEQVRGTQDQLLLSGLISMYGACGLIDEAAAVFHSARQVGATPWLCTETNLMTYSLRRLPR